MKKKRRSKYGGLNALVKAMPLPEGKVVKMDIAARVAWLKLCEGTATPEDYNTIAWAVNILEHGLAHLNNEDLTAPRPEGRGFPIHRTQPDHTYMQTGFTDSPRADTASPAAKTLRAALMSRS